MIVFHPIIGVPHFGLANGLLGALAGERVGFHAVLGYVLVNAILVISETT